MKEHSIQFNENTFHRDRIQCTKLEVNDLSYKQLIKKYQEQAEDFKSLENTYK
jgi:hypothetical protein